MVAIEHVPAGPALDAERRFRALAFAAAGAIVAYAVATAAGLPAPVLSGVFNVPVAAVPVLAWWAYRCSPAEQRRLWLFLAVAATLWLAGTLVWVAAWVANDERVPAPPGAWDVLFIAAYATAFLAIATGMHESVALRHAFLDTVLIVAAAVALGTDILGDRVRDGLSAQTVVIAARPTLGIAILVLLASAAFGSWVGVTRATALVGAGQASIVAGSIVYSYAALQGRFTDDRWPNVLWASGAALSALAAAVVILGIDRPMARERPPLIRACAGAVGSLVLSALAMAATVAVMLASPDRPANAIAVAAVGALAIVSAARAFLAITAARDLAEAMNAETLAAEHEHDVLVLQVEELEARRARVEQELLATRVVHESFRRVLQLKDEETGGRVQDDLGAAAWEMLMLETDPETDR